MITSEGKVTPSNGGQQHAYTAHVSGHPVVVNAIRLSAKDEPVVYLAMRRFSLEDAREVHKALGMAITKAEEMNDDDG